MYNARIASTRSRPDALEAQDQLLAGGVDELFQSSRLRTVTQSRLVTTLGLKTVFDLLATVGFHSTLGYLLNTFETALDEDIKADSTRILLPSENTDTKKESFPHAGPTDQSE